MPSHSENNPRSHNQIEALSSFDEIIDVRTPAEFTVDHIPGAINAPVLSNQERILVGTTYAQESSFKATRMGAALVARNIAQHLEDTFAQRPRHWHPLIYCWRGGKRSGSMTSWFRLIGWQAQQLDGGYKIWRRHVIDQLATKPQKYRFIVLAGATGSGKTRLLQALADIGVQTLDLEALACHRGSLLGALPHQDQPSQKMFETRLLTTLQGLDPEKPVFIEAESRRIGLLSLPQALFDTMHQGRCVHVRVETTDRVNFLLQDYAHLFDQPAEFSALLQKLIGLHSRKTVDSWLDMLNAGERARLFTALVQQHYDPAYTRSSHSHYAGLATAQEFYFQPCANDQHAQAKQLLKQLSIQEFYD